jgi:prevent-host-death family protein
VRKAEAGEAIELTRRGAPVAVLMGRRQYSRLTSKHRRFLRAYERFARDVDLAALDINPDEVFSGVRDQTGGRSVDL